MKKLKYLLFLLPFCFCLNVFAKDVTNYVKYNVDNPAGTYKGDEISLGGYNGKFDVKTRYNGSLSLIEFYLPTSSFEFNSNTTYTISLSMSSNDWRNNFMSPQVIKANNDGTLQSTNGSLTVSNFQFVSSKTIKFNFKTNSSISPYLFFRLYSTDFASSNTTAITGDSWNLSSIVITDNSSSGSSGSSGGTSSGNPSVTCSNGLVLSSKTFDYSNVDISSKYLDSSGQEVSHNSFGILSYVPITGDAVYYLTRNLSTSSTTNYCLYDSTKTLLSCQQYGSTTFFTINTGNASYISLSIRTDYVLTLSTCKSPLDNQNQNTEDIINNQNQNTSNIIENNNYNSQQIIDSGKVCTHIDKNYISIDNHFLNYLGEEYSSIPYGITDYINVNNSTLKVLSNFSSQSSGFTCFYNVNKVLISCTRSDLLGVDTNVNLPTNTYYFRSSIHKSQNLPSFELCRNGNQAITDSITDDNVDGGTGSDFFNDFNSEDFGLSQIITIPLNTIQSLTSKTCVPLQVPIPFTNSNISLPCMSEIYSQFPTIFNLWHIVSFGIIAYLIAIDIFNIVKGFKDPESDKVEVLDL